MSEMSEQLTEQIKEILRNNLQIDIEAKKPYCYEGVGDYYKIELIFDGEVICTAYT